MAGSKFSRISAEKARRLRAWELRQRPSSLPTARADSLGGGEAEERDGQLTEVELGCG